MNIIASINWFLPDASENKKEITQETINFVHIFCTLKMMVHVLFLA